MPFPETLNFDFVAIHVLNDIGSAVRGWRDGRPRDEIAFMNRVTQILGRNRHGCDVGVDRPITMRSQIAMLHRQGDKQVDEYGADVAITIFVNQDEYVKTALFQFKKSDDYQLSLERKQLQDACYDARIETRSFVLAVDEERSGIRIKAVKDILDEFDSTQESKQFNSAKWTCLTQWVWNWFSCDIGPISDPHDTKSVEALLQRFVVEDNWDSPWPVGEEIAPIRQDFLPARAWLVFFFTEKEPSKRKQT